MDFNKYASEVYPLVVELCKIPAPSNFEDKRAEFCKNYLYNAGYKNVYIDDAKNVVCKLNDEIDSDLTVFCAHTDTVFPDLEPFSVIEKNGKAYCPGIGDDTASLAIMLVSAKYLKENNIKTNNGIMFVCNSCEEGLGNLKGIRKIFEDYKGKIQRLISFDSNLDIINSECVGSHRYFVEVETEGGHSFNAFGNENAINVISKMVNAIYDIKIPNYVNTKTTFNVGTIGGGTSVNTIAQSANMLCEYRSNNVNALRDMEKEFNKIFNSVKNDKNKIKVEKVGDRPCADGVDELEQEKLLKSAKNIIEKIIGKEVQVKSGSTDCNIPLSLGIPAIAIGVYYGGKWHTREEFIEIDSLNLGFKVAVDIISLFV